jgi:hypothetical protein
MKTVNKNLMSIGVFLFLAVMAGASCNFSYSVGVPKEPDDKELQKMVKETLASFTDSLEKDDFEIIRKTASSGFRQQFSAEKIRASFLFFVNRKDQAVPLFRKAQSIPAAFDEHKVVEKGGQYLLVTQGSIPLKELTIKFRFHYFREDGKWKVETIDIKT